MRYLMLVPLLGLVACDDQGAHNRAMQARCAAVGGAWVLAPTTSRYETEKGCYRITVTIEPVVVPA